MNFADAEKIAAVVLYEGYILYPYRATSTKNVQRWNFGTLYPQDYAEAQRPAGSFRLHTECLLQADVDAKLDVRARFLQLVRKHAAASQDWEEGVERTVDRNDLRLGDIIENPVRYNFSLNATDTVTDNISAESVSAKNISGCLEIQTELLQNGLHKLSLDLLNITPMKSPTTCAQKDAMLEAFVSAHVLLGMTAGEFVSLLDTPEEFHEAASTCKNIGVFPVLAGEEGQRTMVLCSPIILYDYPKIAPESVGDFFDGTEMDEMLALRVLTLTDDEKQEMRNVDDRARRILERTETLPQDFLMKVHGAIRGMRPVAENHPQEDPK